MWFAAALAALASAPPVLEAQSLVIRNARLIDGTGAPPRGPVSILVRDGRIAGIASDIAAGDVPALDAAGGTVIPGLIDAHVHLTSVPGGEVRGDGAETLRRLRRAHLRSYLACGVTTVLDAGITVAAAGELRAWLAAGEPAPTVLMLGPPIAARGGYMSRLNPDLAVGSVEDLDRAFEAVAGVGAVGVKVPIERGFVSDSTFPIHAPEVRDAIRREAERRRLPIFVHASDEEEQAIALDMGARALAHLNFNRGGPSPEFVARAAGAGVYVVTTFSIIDAGLTRWHADRLDDALVRRAVPPAELETAASPAAWTAHDVAELGFAFPQWPHLARRVLVWLSSFAEAPEAGVLAGNLRAAKRLYDAGVPLAVGSDAGNSSQLSQFHGTSTLRELELLAEAGIAAADVLVAATRIPAEMLGIAADTGTVAPGKRADLVVLAGDPLESMPAIRSIRWTVKGGVARTPEQWMREP